MSFQLIIVLIPALNLMGCYKGKTFEEYTLKWPMVRGIYPNGNGDGICTCYVLKFVTAMNTLIDLKARFLLYLG